MAVILIADDEAALRDALAEALGDLGHRAVEAPDGPAALAALEREAIDAVLLDLRMPGMDGLEVLRRMRERAGMAPPVAVLTAYAGAGNTIEAMRLGAFDHLTKPIGRAALAELLARMLQGHGPGLAKAGPAEDAAESLIGSSEAMRRVQKAIGLAADSDASVLVLGETGTGKEVVARALHAHGRRRDRPFVAVNCAAIPADLLESELFGHVKGAFTGAGADRRGAFREADGGTLLLDEIGDMPLAMQAKILRTLGEKVVAPVGGRPAAVDVRVVAATHRDLPALATAGRFRQDLYYRLNVLPIPLAPLRERLADIVPLAEHFLRFAAAGGAPKRLTAAAAARLLAHPWPGNVRELRNVIERGHVLVRGPVIDAADLDGLMDGHADGPAAPAEAIDWLAGDLPAAVARLETAMIRRALLGAKGNRTEAARRLGIGRQLLYAKIERYGVDRGELSENPTLPVGKDDD